MKELESVLIAFRESTRCDAAVWTADGTGDLVHRRADEHEGQMAAGPK